jgi:hypothetical protein
LVLLFGLFLAGLGSPVQALLSRVWFSSLTKPFQEEPEQESQTLIRRARTEKPSTAKKSLNRRTKTC